MKITPFDASEFFKTTEDFKELLQDALETKNSSYVSYVLGIIARKQGMTAISHETGLNRESLYRSLSKKGDPRLSTFFSVLDALNLQISLKQTPNNCEKTTVLEKI
ncbi:MULTISPECIES: addiction module antidote protein [unclassified Bartonella]|uniref:addiction module antidote protein n=1 Tax=unclassified Bartonella TaxID=2645622 RepID=UPI0031845E1F